MTRLCFVIVFVTCLIAGANAQWIIQESHTTASLRGIHSVNGTIAWASGTNGTVLRTVDGGRVWQTCAVPPDGEKLDFRAVWAWDAKNAMVMSAGPGEASRVYKTTDGCVHWTEELRNKDKDGFWDAMVFSESDATGLLLGDPVRGRFYTETVSMKRSGKWTLDEQSCPAQPGEAAFAASNSSVVVFDSGKYIIGTGGKPGSRVLFREIHDANDRCPAVAVPLATGNESSGIFSVAFRDTKHGIVVGGDYKNPSESKGTAAFTSDGGLHWTAATNPPHGYRSSVAWFDEAKVWIAAGTNGSDVSRDDGKTWQSMDDGDWNALSSPYVVGPKGRVGKLDSTSLKP